MIRLQNVRTPVTEKIDLKAIVLRKLKVNEKDIQEIHIHKKSIDARNKKMFAYVLEIDVKLLNEDRYLGKNIIKVGNEQYLVPPMGNISLKQRPIIIGSGPAGLFCAYELAKYGYKPIIIERGECIEKRTETVDKFWQKGIFNKSSNVQFGEGGAGTFSDGKLNTLVKDKMYRMKEIFEIFVECGAPAEIMYENNPHIGTDVLRKVIVNIRNKIIELGGTFYYNSLMEEIIVKNNKIEGIRVNGEILKTDILVLAIGHSARDTFRMLNEKNVLMESKPFAVGVRIIHEQKLINDNQYPINYKFLPPANYKLTYKSKDGRGVYSFCMCPGGLVVDARSNKNQVVVNGMSNYKRDSGYANSAIVTTVNEKDYGTNLMSGLEFQEKIETSAYKIGNGHVPWQRYEDYKLNKTSADSEIKGLLGRAKASNINEIFPKEINKALKEGIDYFDTKIKNFAASNPVIVAPETRTSSPIRIIRDDDLESNIKGMYPCGEGAGYAGGITTSAIDGLKVFESIRKKYISFKK